jgi:hypothetical protein
MKLLTPTVMKLLTYVIVVVFGAIAFNGVFSLANYAAEKEARIVTRCDQILRARLVLTHAAKRKYDKRFRKENDALSLRYISQNDKYIYVMYHDFVIWHDVKHKPPVLREYYGFTYAVPRTDVDLLIIRDPPKNPNGKC